MGRDTRPPARCYAADNLAVTTAMADYKVRRGIDMRIDRVKPGTSLLEVVGDQDGLAQKIGKDRHYPPAPKSRDLGAGLKGDKTIAGIDKGTEIEPLVGSRSGRPCCPPGIAGAKQHAWQEGPATESALVEAIGPHQMIGE